MIALSGSRARLVSLCAAIVLGACADRLETADTCPALCPGQGVPVLEAVIDPAIVFDSTVRPFPLLGSEVPLLLSARGDTLDVRAVVRFDTLPRQFAPVGDTVRRVTMVDSAALTVQLRRTSVPLPPTFHVDAFDVTDPLDVDTLPLELLPNFRADRLLGSVRVDSGGFGDSLLIVIPLDTARVRPIVTDTTRGLRIGLRVRASQSVEVTLTGTAGGTIPTLRYRATTDTTVPRLLATPYSRSPLVPVGLNGEFQDYSMIVRAPEVRAPARFVLGGIPGHRAYLRFDLPTWVTDSVAVLSARLELTQDPIRGLDATQPFIGRVVVGLGGWELADLGRATRLTAPAGAFIADSLVLVPGDSGVRRLEMQAVLRNWRTVNGRRIVPSALIFYADREGGRAPAARFFGATAPLALRPRLRISYVPSIRYGRP